MGTALAGPQPTPPLHSAFPVSDLELVVDGLFPFMCGLTLLRMLSLRVLNGASPHADPQFSARPSSAKTHGTPPPGLGQRSRAGTAEGAPGLLTHRCPERGARGRSRGRRVTSRLGRAHLGKRADP